MSVTERTPRARPAPEYVSLPVAKIVPNPDQPRQHFEPLALEELAASLRRHGVLQPLVVRPLGRGRYRLVAGERRWRAAQLAELVAVPCRVLRDVSDAEAFVLSVLENCARADMNPIEEGKAFQVIMASGHSREEVAALVGRSPEYVAWRVDLLALDASLQELAASGQLSKNLAWYLSRLSIAGQYEVVRKLNAGLFATDDAACRYAIAVRLREQQPDLFTLTPAEGDPERAARRRQIRDRWERAWEQLGRCEPLLRELQESETGDLAAALGAGVPRWQEQFRLLGRTAGRIGTLLAQAAAMAEATDQRMTTREGNDGEA